MADMKVIYLVDDNSTNLIVGKSVLESIYRVYGFDSGATMIKMLPKVPPDLILLDIIMPMMSGYDVLAVLKSDPKYADIPVIMLTANDKPEVEAEALKRGAVDFVTKPFSNAVLLKRVENHLMMAAQKKQLSERAGSLNSMIGAQSATALSLRTSAFKTFIDISERSGCVQPGESDKAGAYFDALLKAMVSMGVYVNELMTWNHDFLTLSASIYDFGKYAVGAELINRRGVISDVERALIQQHPKLGFDTLQQYEKNSGEKDLFVHAKQFVFYHHENWDGSGYPLSLRGTSIPLEGRMAALIDCYKAMVSPRPYHAPLTHEAAAEKIFARSGRRFDPDIVSAFASVDALFKGITEKR